MSVLNKLPLYKVLQTLQAWAFVSSLCINALALSKFSLIHFLRLSRAGNNKIQDKVWVCEISTVSKLYNFTTSFLCISPAFCYQTQ